MPVAEKPYRRLGGTWVGVMSRRRLWLAADHLLSVTMSGWSEDYKRFYFRDIEAIVICRTDVWLLGYVIFGAMAAIFPLIGAGLNDLYWRAFWFSIGGVFLLLLTVNGVLGPSCICQIRTAVQVESLPALRRLRRARKFVARMKPLIDGAQVTLERGASSSEPTVEATACPGSAAAPTGGPDLPSAPTAPGNS